MKKTSNFIGLTLLLALAVFSASAYSTTPVTALMDKANTMGSVRIIVRMNIDYQTEGELSSTQAIQAQHAQISHAQGNILDRLASYKLSAVKRFATIPYMAMEVDPAALDALSKDPDITDIEEDIPVPPTLQQSIPFINADDVHTMGTNGSGITVAILDSGVRNTHNFLDAGKVVSEACYSSNYAPDSATTLCPGGGESQTGPGSGVNCNTSINGCSHGTHVAGIAAGTGGPSGLVGVAPGANVIAIQVFSKFDDATICNPYTTCIRTYSSDQILGLERVYALRNTYTIAAANMSLGGGQYSNFCDSDSRKAIIDNLRAAGIATVIASGNNYWNGSVSTPGCISSAITVGATLNNSNSVADYSNHASMVDLMAPGSSIYSSIATDTATYESKNGTSMAAPHVAGAFAIMKQTFPMWSVNQIEAALEATGVNTTRAGITKPRIDLLAAINLTPPPSDNDFLLDTMPAILAAVAGGTPPPPTPVAPQWGAYNELCCTTSSVTYGVTQGSQYRSSTLSSCSGTPSFNGYVTTSAGSKFFSHRTTSSTCGSLVGSGSQTLQSGKRYLWVAEYNSGNPKFVLYSRNISSASGNLSASNLSSSSTPADMTVEASGPLFLEQDSGDGQSSFQPITHPRTSP